MQVSEPAPFSGRSSPITGAAALLTISRLLLRANMRSRHRRTLLGYLWLAIPGMASAFAFSLLRKGQLLAVGEVAMPYPLFVLSGVFLWQAFVDALIVPTQHLVQQRRFLSLVAAPFEAVVIAAAGEVLINLAIRMAILAAAMLVFGQAPDSAWLLLPCAGLAMVAIGLVLGLYVAPFAQLYDDVASLVSMAATFGIFLVPIFYPVPAESGFASNPFAWILDDARGAMIGDFGGATPLWIILVSAALLVPAWLFNAASRPHIAARAY